MSAGERFARSDLFPVGRPAARRKDATPEATSPAAPLLRIESIRKSFRGRTAVDGVSFDVDRGEMVAVLGPSGAGKTTLFRCLTGLGSPDEGRVLFEGASVHTLPRSARRRIAVVFQDFNLVRRLTALENVLGGRLGHVSGWRGALRRFERPDMLKALECLERVGMLEQAAQRADTLSGGQQQRVAIARALAQEPRLIVADEPVASLDPGSAGGVLQLLTDIARDDRVAVILSLHQVGYARTHASRIIGLSAGRLVIDAATAALADRDFDALYATSPTSQQPAPP